MPHLERALTPFPQVALILSSSWCVWPGYGKTLKRLPPTLRDRFVGGTYHQREHGSDPRLKAAFQSTTRGQQVVADVLRRRPGQWLALDDHTENWPEWALPNLVACDGRTGLSDVRVQAELDVKLKWCVRDMEKDAARHKDQLACAPRANDASHEASPPQGRDTE